MSDTGHCIEPWEKIRERHWELLGIQSIPITSLDPKFDFQMFGFHYGLKHYLLLCSAAGH